MKKVLAVFGEDEFPMLIVSEPYEPMLAYGVGYGRTGLLSLVT